MEEAAMWAAVSIRGVDQGQPQVQPRAAAVGSWVSGLWEQARAANGHAGIGTCGGELKYQEKQGVQGLSPEQRIF